MDDKPILDTIKRLRDLLAAATPGPWTTTSGGLVWADGGTEPVCGATALADAELITAMRNELPDLLMAAEWLHHVLQRRDELAAEVRAAENAAKDYRRLLVTLDKVSDFLPDAYRYNLRADLQALDERHAEVMTEYPPTD